MVVAHLNVLLLWRAILNPITSYDVWLAWKRILVRNGKVRNDEVEARENLVCFQASGIYLYISWGVNLSDSSL